MIGLDGIRSRSSASPEPEQKRSRPSISSSENHYDIYFLPSRYPLLPLPLSLTNTSASFFVVNAQAGLETGLGIRYGLQFSAETGLLTPEKDAGFCLHRDERYNASEAVLLGWVEQEMLVLFEEVVGKTEVGQPARWAGESRNWCTEWVMAVVGRLEMEGILANGDLLVKAALR